MNEQDPQTFEEIAAILKRRGSPLQIRQVIKPSNPEPAPCFNCGQMYTELLMPAGGLGAICPTCFLKAHRG